MTTFNLTCEAVEATLQDYLDESLEPWVRESIHEHLGECARCAGLARDLRNLEREAAALPALLPERDIWPEVAHGIGAPIITSESVPENQTLVAPSEPPVASASLPISEPSLLTGEPSLPTSEASLPTSDASPPMSEPSLQTSEPSLPMSEPSLPTSEPSLPTSKPALPTSEPSVRAVEPLRRSAEAPVSTTAPVSKTAPVSPTAPAIALRYRREKRWGPAWMGMAAAALLLVTNGTTFLLTARRFGPARTPNVVTDTGTRRPSSPAEREGGIGAPSVGGQQIASDSLAGPLLSSVVATTSAPRVRSPDEVVYDKEINMLQAMRRGRKAELDASTTAVIERNLRIIDSNIAQIRAALQKDPGSPLLSGQVSRALDMKVELLRRVAMLRSNT
jgi:putative zinc finger protein